jgi:hypothetical protein
MTLEKKGVDVHVASPVQKIEKDGDKLVVTLKNKKGEELAVKADKVLMCVGRRPNTAGVFSDDILNAPEGIYKYMQNAYGCGGTTQTVWVNAREIIKYDENYAALNAEVGVMDDAIQYTPVVPNFDDLTAEDASLMQTSLGDAFSVWDDAFVRGTKDIEADWDAYVEEMKDKGIDEFLSLYNEYNKYR